VHRTTSLFVPHNFTHYTYPWKDGQAEFTWVSFSSAAKFPDISPTLFRTLEMNTLPALCIINKIIIMMMMKHNSYKMQYTGEKCDVKNILPIYSNNHRCWSKYEVNNEQLFPTRFLQMIPWLISWYWNFFHKCGLPINEYAATNNSTKPLAQKYYEKLTNFFHRMECAPCS